MSGTNRQGGQGGQQPPQSGQQRGGQQQGGQQPAQGGQQPRGQAGQSPQGGGPPQQTGGGGGGIDTAAIRNVVLWGLAVFAIAGIAFGLIPLLFGFAGDPGESTETVDANSTEADRVAQEEQLANEIIRDDLSDDNKSAASAYDRMQSQNGVVRLVVDNPIIGVIFALVLALVIGLKSGADEKSLVAGVAVATVVGLVLFVLLSSAIAGFQYNSMSEDDWKNEYNTNPNDWGFNEYPPGDIDQETQQRWQDEYESEFGEQPTQSVQDAASVPTISTIDALQINYGTMVINSLLYGIATALGAAAIAGVSRRLSDELA